MIDALVWAVALPLVGALLCVLMPRMAPTIGVATSLATATAAVATLWLVATQGPVEYAIGGWSPGLGIALQADGLSALLLSMSALVCVGVSLYATAYFINLKQRRAFWPL